MKIRYKQYDHQVKELEEHWDEPGRALLWQPRTGKTKAIIDNACKLFENLEISGVLVIAPNGVHLGWLDEIEKHGWQGFIHQGFAWRFSQPHNAAYCDHFLHSIKLLPERLHWFTVNVESISRKEILKVIKRFKKLCGSIMIVFDESHHLARPGSKRTRSARGIARLGDYNRLLTGTVMENSPLQAYSQYELLGKNALGFSKYKDFKNHFATFKLSKGSRQYLVVDEYINLEELTERMAKYSSAVLRSDCHDLPDIQNVIRYFEPTVKQKKFWDQIKKKDILLLESLGFDKPMQIATILLKLQQIEGGFIKLEDKVDIVDKVNPGIEALLEEIELSSGSIIVWCQFIHEIQMIDYALRASDITAVAVYGMINAEERNIRIKDFMKRTYKVLVAQPQTIGEGRDLSVANTMIWFSQPTDAIIRTQASDRATKMGDAKTQIIHLLIKGGVNERWMRLTDDKTSRADKVSRQGLKDILESVKI